MLLAFDSVYPELPQLNELRSGFVGFIFLDFFNFLVAFFDAMDFLLHSNCTPGRSQKYRQIGGRMSRQRTPQLIFLWNEGDTVADSLGAA